MSKPFDSVFKDLLEKDPSGWIELAFGPVVGLARVVDADISTVSGAADKVVVIEGPSPSIVHFEAAASWDATLPARAMGYNAMHHRRHLLPVDTVIVLLRPEADHPRLTGNYSVASPMSGLAHSLEYAIVRVWLLDLERLLSGPLGLLPLAVVTDQARARLPEVVRRLSLRLESEAAPEERKDLLTDAFILAGLRLPPEAVQQLFRGGPAMRESSTYQLILEEGREVGREEGREVGREEGRRAGLVSSLLLVGDRRLGEPSPQIRARIEGEVDVARLEEWLRQVLQVESWTEVPGLGE